MPVDRTLGADIAGTIAELYHGLEVQLADQISRQLRAGIAEPPDAAAQLAALGILSRGARSLLNQIQRDLTGTVEQAVVLAYHRGGEAAIAELAKRSGMSDRMLAELRRQLPQLGAIQRMVYALTSKLLGTHVRILRWEQDAYRSVMAKTLLTGTLTGRETRLRSAQRAWEELLSRGITGFTDKAGRNWQLASYVEMATRTGTAQAAVQGNLDRLGAAGIDLVIVSDAPQECARCRPWEGKVLARTGPGARTVQALHGTQDRQVTVHVAGSVLEAVEAGLMHPNCFPGDVLVSAPSGVVAADARRYEGPIVVIHTASGDELPVTPNHPVLTPEGWVAAGDLHEGQSVLRYRAEVEHAALSAPDDHQVPARIGDVFDALREASAVPTVRVPVAAEQFHGDGLGSDVDVVLADGLLGHGARQPGGQGELVDGGVRASALLAEGAALEVAESADHPPHGGVSGAGLGGSLLCRHGGVLPKLSLAAADSGPTPEDPAADAGLADVEGGRELGLALAGQVAPDEVVHIGRREFSGHVYNLQTGDGWYVAGGIVVHNCRHSLSAYLPGVTRLPTDTADPDGDLARQKLRALERKVRRAKLQAAGALEPQAKKRFEAEVRAAQAEIREHLKTAPTQLFRQPHRERIGTAR